MGPVKLEFHFGRVFMRLVEVAGMITSCKPLFCACALL